MINEIGHFALVLALCIAALQSVVPLVGAARNDAALMGWARPAALAQFLRDPSRAAAVAFNQKVASYEHERRGPVRAVVASVLGDDAIPVLDTTAPPSAASSGPPSS